MTKVLPAITGYPLLDSLLRGLLFAAAGALATLSIPTLAKYGINDPKTLAEVPTFIFAALFVGLSMLWSRIRDKQVVKSMLDHTISAVEQGAVPAVFQVAATADQLKRIDAIDTRRSA